MLKRLSSRTSSGMLLVALSNVFFVGSMLLAMVFLWSGSLNLVRLDDQLGSNGFAKLRFDTLLSMIFFIQHSTMIRRPFRRFLAKFVAIEYHGAIYTITSAVALTMVVVLWQKATYVAVAPTGFAAYLVMRAMFVLAIQGLHWAANSLKSLDLCGVEPLRRKLGKTEKPPPAQIPLCMSGPFRYVRHPFYFCCLVLFWSCPNLTLDRLLFNVLWSTWVVVGTLLEERDLVMDFGEPYRQYQRKVPMLIPWAVQSEPIKVEQVGKRGR